MASTRRRSGASVTSRIFEQPQAFEFFQLIRLHEALAAEEREAAGVPPPDPVGSGVDPENAALAVRSLSALSFAASEVLEVRRPKIGNPTELLQNVIGLTGSSGPLPHAVSELVLASARERNPALREFLDLFNNRLAGLLYEAWAKYRIVIERERAARLGTRQRIDGSLRSLVGFGLASLKRRTHVFDETLIFSAGLIAPQQRSAGLAARAIATALGHPVRIRQFCGQWLTIDPADRTCLPENTAPNGAHARLGEDAVIGQRAFEVQSCVLICVGPLTYDQFRTLLPDGERAGALNDMTALALGADKTFHIRLELAADDVPRLSLGGDHSCRLGLSTWLTCSGSRTQSVQVDLQPQDYLT